MSRDQTFLVIGATGRTGRHVVSGLLEHGAQVRALVRRSLTAGLSSEVSVIEGDLHRPETVAKAAEGADAAFLLWPGFDPAGAEEVVAALAGQVSHVVYLSAGTAEGASEGVWSEVERLIEASGLRWTFLRAGGFAANTLGWAEQLRAGDVIEVPYPEAARSLVHEHDIADVAIAALRDPRDAGRVIDVTGPEVLSQREQVRTIGEVLGRPLEVREQSASAALRELEPALGVDYARSALATWASFVEHPEEAAGDVEKVTGKPARTFAQWVRDHVADFAPAGSTTEIAETYAHAFRTGRIDQATSLMSPEFVRLAPLETGGHAVEIRGVDAVLDNAEQQNASVDINGVDVGEPLVSQNQFAIRFSFDETDRTSGNRQTTTKMSLYTVDGDRIVREEVSYLTPPHRPAG